MNKNKITLNRPSRPVFFVLFLLALCAVCGAEPSADRRWMMARRLYSDSKAKRIGDILTVIIDEKSQSAKDAKGSSSKNTSLGGLMSISHPTIDNRPTAWTNATGPTWSLNTTRSFDGAGSAENNDTFITTMSVTVRDLLPNGNLLVEGSRAVVIRDNGINLILTGMVRPQDITRANTISSAQIANAVIRYESTGVVAKDQDRGAVTRLLDWINPF